MPAEILIRGVTASGKELSQGDVLDGDYKHICATLYHGTLNVLVDPIHTAALLPAFPHQIIDHDHWDHSVMWWKGWTMDRDGDRVDLIVTYEPKQPYAHKMELLSDTHLRTALGLVDGSPVEFWIIPWWARAE